MQIKYIKDAPNGPKGMRDTVTDFEGNVLIRAGFAVPDDTESTTPKDTKEPEPKAKSKTKAKATTKTDNE